MSSDSITPPLSQGWGYGVAVGLGIVFALAMMLVTHLLFKYNHENNENFETYSTAGRSVGVGLTAVAVISSWAWSTALLSSSVMTYSYGVSGALLWRERSVLVRRRLCRPDLHILSHGDTVQD